MMMIKPNMAHDLEVHLNLSTDCNMSCSYCFSRCQKKGAWSVEKAKSVIDEIYKKFGGEEIFFTVSASGEPLLYKNQFMEIYRYIKGKSGIRPFFMTNGTLLDDEILEMTRQDEVGKNPQWYLHVSLDGDEKIHNAQRSDFALIMKNVKNAQKKGWRIFSSPTLTGDYDVNEILDFFYKSYISVSCLSIVKGRNDWWTESRKKRYLETLGNAMKRINEEVLEGNLKWIYIARFYFGRQPFLLNEKSMQPCYADYWRYFTIDIDGNISKCDYASPVANIFDFDLEKFKAEFSEEKWNESLTCKNPCKFYKYCSHSVCRYAEEIDCKTQKILWQSLTDFSGRLKDCNYKERILETVRGCYW